MFVYLQFLPKQVPLRASVIKVKEFLNQHFYAIEETRGIGSLLIIIVGYSDSIVKNFGFSFQRH